MMNINFGSPEKEDSDKKLKDNAFRALDMYNKGWSFSDDKEENQEVIDSYLDNIISANKSKGLIK